MLDERVKLNSIVNFEYFLIIHSDAKEALVAAISPIAKVI